MRASLCLCQDAVDLLQGTPPIALLALACWFVVTNEETSPPHFVLDVGGHLLNEMANISVFGLGMAEHDISNFDLHAGYLGGKPANVAVVHERVKGIPAALELD